jgi:hypothetical protein
MLIQDNILVEETSDAEHESYLDRLATTIEAGPAI